MSGVLGTNRQIIEQDIRSRLFQSGNNLWLCGLGKPGQNESPVFRIFFHMGGKTVTDMAHQNLYTGWRNVTLENMRTVGGGENCMGYIFSHFARIYVPGSHYFNIAGLISPDQPMHQAAGIFCLAVSIVSYSLD